MSAKLKVKKLDDAVGRDCASSAEGETPKTLRQKDRQRTKLRKAVFTAPKKQSPLRQRGESFRFTRRGARVILRPSPFLLSQK